MSSTRAHRWQWLLGIGLALALVACGETPQERYTGAQAAAERQDFEAFRSYFTRGSADLLRGLDTAGKRSRLYYIKEPMRVLPQGDLENAIQIDNFAVLSFKVRGKKQDVWMFLEDGAWKIDLTSLPGFWANLSQP